MSFLKRIVTAIALLYLVLALLVLFLPSVRSSTVGIFSVYSLPMEVNLLLGFTWAAVGVVSLLLVFENIDSGLLRRKVNKQNAQINELKAQLYEAQKPLVPSAPQPPLSTPATYLPPAPPTPY